MKWLGMGFFGLLMPLAAAGTSAHYSLNPTAFDHGGLTGGSQHYRVNSSLSAGGVASSSRYITRSGFVGQLSEMALQVTALGMTLAAPALTLDEAGNLQLNASLTNSDATATPLDPGSVTWSVQSGPISTISPAGLATAAHVYQDTFAVVRGAYQNFSATLAITIHNTGNDDFAAYAGDGLPDLWQLQNFGENGMQGGPTSDADRDGLNNLLEYAFGTNPNQPTTAPVAWNAMLLTARGVPTQSATTSGGITSYRAVFARRKDYLAANLAYTAEFSRDLVTWSASSVTPTVIASDSEMDAVAVPFPPLSSGQQTSFFRLKVALHAAATAAAVAMPID